MKPPEKVIIKDSTIHGKGMFATKNIIKEEKIIEYVGEIISNEEGDVRATVTEKDADHKTKGAVYLFTIDDDHVLDGNVDWNPARFINHSCDPNCESGFEDKQIFIYALKKITKGQELTYDYGYEVSDDYKSHPCFCQAKNCFGYIISAEEKEKLRNNPK